MTNKGARLERMANEIAMFFRSYPHDEGVAGVRDHLRDFWAPIMRRDLAEHAADHPSGLDPLVVAALGTLSAGKSPVQRAAAGPGQLGEIGASDAG